MVEDRGNGTVDVTTRRRGLSRLRNSVWRGMPGSGFLRSEEGSITAFSLFIFLMMLFVGGMAVDLMRFETRRAALQNTLDAATLAATNLRSDSDATQLVKDIMTKRVMVAHPNETLTEALHRFGWRDVGQLAVVDLRAACSRTSRDIARPRTCCSS